MKLNCPKCAGKAQIDDSKIPDSGIHVRCPRCDERFFLRKNESIAPSPAADHDTAAGHSGMDRHFQPGQDPKPEIGRSEGAPLQETCSLCRSKFSQLDMIHLGDTWVCARCKPRYLQMLQQGLHQNTEMRYAGFWIRFAAKFVDGLIVGALGFVLSFVLSFPFAMASPSGIDTISLAEAGFRFLAQILIPAAYATYFVGKYRATPGKMACGLVIVTSDNGDVSYSRALGRHFSEFLSSILLLIGYIMAAFDGEKRALHDRICDTRVVYK